MHHQYDHNCLSINFLEHIEDPDEGAFPMGWAEDALGAIFQSEDTYPEVSTFWPSGETGAGSPIGYDSGSGEWIYLPEPWS